MIYAFGAMLSFTMAHVSLIQLRVSAARRRAALAQPGRDPLPGRHVPAARGLRRPRHGIALVVVTALDVRVLIAGRLWLAIGIVTYVIYRRSAGAVADRDPKIVAPKPAVEHEVEYESVLVAFEDGHFSPDAVATAVRLAARRRRGSTCW